MILTCISIRNPLSWLVTAGLKDVENRSWTTDYRDWLYIHSSGSSGDGAYDLSDLPLPVYNEYIELAYRDAPLESARYLEARSDNGMPALKVTAQDQASLREFAFIERMRARLWTDEPFFEAGCIVGRVKIAAIREGWTGSPWATDEQYQWILRDAQFFQEPIRGVKGKLRLFKHEIGDADLPALIAVS